MPPIGTPPARGHMDAFAKLFVALFVVAALAGSFGSVTGVKKPNPEDTQPPDPARQANAEERVRLDLGKMRAENLRRMHKAQVTTVRRVRILQR